MSHQREQWQHCQWSEEPPQVFEIIPTSSAPQELAVGTDSGSDSGDSVATSRQRVASYCTQDMLALSLRTLCLRMAVANFSESEIKLAREFHRRRRFRDNTRRYRALKAAENALNVQTRRRPRRASDTVEFHRMLEITCVTEEEKEKKKCVRRKQQTYEAQKRWRQNRIRPSSSGDTGECGA